MSRITPCLWFDKQAEEAAQFYVSLLPDSRILAVKRAVADFPGGTKGDVLTVEFTVGGQAFTGLNGGPLFSFTEAVSFVIKCADQAEVDRLWQALISNGGSAVQCGWLKDRYGLSWQIVPEELDRLLDDPDPARAQRAMEKMLTMVRLDIGELRRAADAQG